MAYFLFGDIYLSYYKYFGFVGLKILQSFFRGSAANVDAETNSENNKSYYNENFSNIFEDATGPFFSILNKVGYSAFLLVCQ
jgi:hypothetical protein